MREASELFSYNLLEDVAIQREIGDDLFQLPILVAQRAELAQLLDAQTGKLFLPAVERLLADRVTPAEIVSVTRNDSSAALEVIPSQNACQPPPAACHRIAASGSSTMMLSQIDAAPTRSDVVPYRPPKRLGPRPPSPFSVSSGRVASGLGSTVAVIQSPACRSS